MAAQEENVRFVALTEPVDLIGNERGHVVQVQCQHVRPTRRDGQSRLIPVEGSRMRSTSHISKLDGPKVTSKARGPSLRTSR